MRIVICYEWAPNSRHVPVSRDSQVSGSLATAAFSEHDPVAVELGRRLANDTGAELVGLSVGLPETAQSMVKQVAVSHGLDRIVLVNDPGPNRAGATATGLMQAAAIDRIGEVELVLAGDSSFDAASRVVPTMVGGVLGWPILTEVRWVVRDGASWRVKWTHDGTGQSRWVTGPVVMTVAADAVVPHMPRTPSLVQADERPAETARALDRALRQVGLA